MANFTLNPWPNQPDTAVQQCDEGTSITLLQSCRPAHQCRLACALSGERIEIRGFGSFSNHYRKARLVRNSKTGEVGILKPGKFVPHFEPGKELKKRIDSIKVE